MGAIHFPREIEIHIRLNFFKKVVKYGRQKLSFAQPVFPTVNRTMIFSSANFLDLLGKDRWIYCIDCSDR